MSLRAARGALRSFSRMAASTANPMTKKPTAALSPRWLSTAGGSGGGGSVHTGPSSTMYAIAGVTAVACGVVYARRQGWLDTSVAEKKEEPKAKVQENSATEESLIKALEEDGASDLLAAAAATEQPAADAEASTETASAEGAADPAPEAGESEEGAASDAAAAAAAAIVPLSATYVIVGGGTAAHFAMRGILERDEKAHVLIITAEDVRPYVRTPLSKELWNVDELDEDINFKDYGGRSRSLFYRKPGFYTAPDELGAAEGQAVALLTGHEVVDMDVHSKVLELDDGRTVMFDKLLLATGGRPKSLPVFDNAEEAVRERVIRYRTIDDFKRLREVALAGKDIAIVGGGFLGSELSASLANFATKTGASVTQVFPEKGNIAAVLPRYLSKWVTGKVVASGVQVTPEVGVEHATLDSESGKVKLQLSNGSHILADHVLVAVGLQPNTELAEKAGLEICRERGGILVNSELEARRDIWAAGDVCSFYDMSLGRRREEHYDHATVSGRLAGENMAGARKAYTHQSMFWSDVGPEIGFEAIGILDSKLKTYGVWAAPTAPAKPVEASEAAANDTASAPADGDLHAGRAQTKSQFDQGVVFYLRDKRVVGVLLWNIYDRIPIAREVIRRAEQFDNLDDLKRIFRVSSAPPPPSEEGSGEAGA